MSDEPRIVASLNNEFQAEVVRGLLTDAGIRSMQRRGSASVIGTLGDAGPLDVLVTAQDFERARAVIGERETPASETVGDARPTPPRGSSSSDRDAAAASGRRNLFAMVKRMLRDGKSGDRPDDPFGRSR
jgi:hypothetical protein